MRKPEDVLGKEGQVVHFRFAVEPGWRSVLQAHARNPSPIAGANCDRPAMVHSGLLGAVAVLVERKRQSAPDAALHQCLPSGEPS